MENFEWWHRLQAVIEEAVKEPKCSYRSISLAADVGENRVSQILDKGPIFPGPSAEVVRRICGALNVSLTYIYTGADLTPEMEEFLSSWAKMPESKRSLLLEVAENLQSDSERIEEHNADLSKKVAKK